ncbi:dna cross-link repair protein snm1, partial [Nannochloropsis gaditana CCMP526]
MNKDNSVHQVPDTPVLVDAFRKYHCPAVGSRAQALFFLSHYHADHYQGLSMEWST